MADYDVAVVGAGPAGAALASVLAPRYRVVLLDRLAEPLARIGESLIPAARRLLRDMGLLTAFEAQGYPAYLGNRSFWGGAEQRTDFIRDPDGPGWHLDRAGFERFMRAAAVARGAKMMAPVRLLSVARSGSGWRLTLKAEERGFGLRARLVVDAGGRTAPLAKMLGAVRQNTDRTVAHWLHGTDAPAAPPDAGFSTVESTREGWWYTAPLNGQRVVAFHADPDGETTKNLSTAALVTQARALPGIGPLLQSSAFVSDKDVTTTAANSARLRPYFGTDWLAIGDAALSFDPLASRGLFHALYSGYSGAAACDAVLQGQASGFESYADDLDRIVQAYNRHLAVFYSAERRWPDAPFWRRRQHAFNETNA